MHRHRTWTWNPSSLQDLARRCLLKDAEMSITDLEDIPTELFPYLLLDAVSFRSLKTLKGLVLTWPFPVLPLGIYIQQSNSVTAYFKALMDGLDALLAQKVRHRRCKLQVVDFRPISEKFWHRWCGTPIQSSAYGKEPVDHGNPRKHTSASLEMVLDITFGFAALTEQITYILNWARERKGVHLCCKKITFYEEPMPSLLLSGITAACVQEMAVFFTWTSRTMGWFAPFTLILGCMSNLQGLHFITRHGPQELQEQEQYGSLLAAQLPRLQRLRELRVECPFFLRGHVGQILRCLTRSLETLCITECPLPEPDLTDLFQCPNLTQLKELCLRGIPLCSVGESLPVLLENCVSTLQDVDLGVCGLLDTHLEVLLPVLKLCSQLRVLNLRGNRMSMGTLVLMLQHLAGLPHLMLEVYPAPQESYSAPNVLHQRTFELLCAELTEVLSDLGKPRKISIITHYSCLLCGLKFIYNSEPFIKGGYAPECFVKHISFGLTEMNQ
ncbi:PRAME family member 12-like [Sorex fumeus]|uniref:PRAME family member 12-like n=1 Tax=Sorex fumeus TaxID=62283 RepID=UPI0024AD8AB1|nr:PRAME family member 12-like [Sorex fumeus]